MNAKFFFNGRFCGMENFKNVYGQDGIGYFIIHHIFQERSVSQKGLTSMVCCGNYRFDFVKQFLQHCHRWTIGSLYKRCQFIRYNQCDCWKSDPKNWKLFGTTTGWRIEQIRYFKHWNHLIVRNVVQTTISTWTKDFDVFSRCLKDMLITSRNMWIMLHRLNKRLLHKTEM